MITEQISQLTTYVQALSKKQFFQYGAAALIGVGILALGTTFYIYRTSTSLVQQIQKLNTNTNKIAQLIAQNDSINQEEEKIRELLDKNPGFNMSTYFERFYTKHQIKPEPNWKPEEGATIEGSQPEIKYQEIILQATFKNQSMEKLVTLLQDINKEPIIYLKALEIAAAGKRINFDVTLATKQYKKEPEEG